MSLLKLNLASVVLVGAALLGSTNALRSDETEPASQTQSERRAAMVRRIDEIINARLNAEGVEPAARSSDAEFLRRVSLDLTGAIPRVADVRAFLAYERPTSVPA